MINGLRYMPNFVSEKEQIKLISHIDSQIWSKDLKRRTQQYGYKYDYSKKKVNAFSFLGKIPYWLDFYCYKLVDAGYFKSIPDQIIINEYLPGQGILKHIDNVEGFGDTIATLSLNSTCIMQLENKRVDLCGDIPLAALSLLVMSHEARYDWFHSIPARMHDTIVDQVIPRNRRISLTFRTVLL